MLKNKKLSQVRFTPSWLSQRKGWIKVVEAFFAILLIGGAILIIINQNASSNENISSGIYEDELAILRAVQLNDTLRANILGLGE